MTTYFHHPSPLNSDHSYSPQHASHNPESPLRKSSQPSSSKSVNSERTLTSEREISVDAFDSYLEGLNGDFLGEKTIVTDRFIPTRKNLKT